jgi:NAD+ kinase
MAEALAGRMRVVVVVKQTAAVALREHRALRRKRGAKADRRPGRAAARLRAAHDAHQRTLEDVQRALESCALPFTEVRPSRLDGAGRKALARAALVVCVGGDGTLLAAARHVHAGLVLGVNSAPGDSVGHFCAVDREGFPRLLARVLDGRASERHLRRLEVRLDDRLVIRRVLNDVLLTHLVPAATTRYELRVAGRHETHRSSGLWIATPAGSTAAIRSAGGRVLPVESRRLQYRVRELYREPGRDYRLVGGVLPEGGSIEVVSRMPEGRLYADGARRIRRFPFGSRALFRLGDEPLRLVSRVHDRP